MIYTQFYEPANQTPQHQQQQREYVPVIPSNAPPLRAKPPSPWSPKVTKNQPVFDTHQWFPMLAGSKLEINPSLRMATGPDAYPLIVDFRGPLHKIWKRPKDGWDEVASAWTGVSVARME